MRENIQLEALADYTDYKRLKKLFQNYSNLEKLAQAGDSTASSIFIDLKTALYKENVVTAKQRESIECHLIDGMTVKEVADYLGKNPTTILESANTGLKRISTALTQGSLYYERSEHFEAKDGE